MSQYVFSSIFIFIPILAPNPNNKESEPSPEGNPTAIS
jgi:hypothetical protein